MKAIKRNSCLLLVLFAAVSFFSACSNEQTAYLEEDTNISGIQEESVCKTTPYQFNSSDYEIIPIGTNNYVYVPKMTSAKSVTRSTETTKTYTATIEGEAYSVVVGKLYVTITWDSKNAYYSVSDGYTYVHQSFTYKIDGKSIDVQLSFRVYKGGAYFGDFNYSGVLSGS